MSAALAPAIPTAAAALNADLRRAVGNPVNVLLETRDSLRLTDVQVESLRRIEADLRQRNEPRLRQRPEIPASGRSGMRGEGGMCGGVGGAARGGAPADGERRAVEAIQRNHQAAMAQVRAVRTAAQRPVAVRMGQGSCPRRRDEGDRRRP